jgi:hypothetical protein
VARAHLFRPITDVQGNLLYGATVTVRDTDFSVPVAQALWTTATGTDQYPNPLTAVNGVIDFWLDTPQRVSLLIQATGVADIQVYLDAQPPPEQIVTSPDAPLAIVNTPSTSGQVLLSTSTPGQVQWGTAPTGTSLTPIVVVSSQSFNAGSDPAGWTFAAANGGARSYDAATLPAGTTYFYSLKTTQSANNGTMTVTGPTFTLLEAGALSLWVKTQLATGENFTVRTHDAGFVYTTWTTLATTRDWGFYSFTLPAGTYTPVFTYTGNSVFDGTVPHAVWMTGYVAQYGGNVPPHNHNGTGTNSVALGTSAVASATGSVAVGATASATGTNSSAFGYGASAAGNSAVAVGMASVAGPDYSLAVGAGAVGSPTATAWASVGYGANANGQEAVAVGRNAAANSDYSVAVGSGAAAGASGTAAVAVGQNATAAAASSAAVGTGASVGSTHTNSVALGSGSATTAASQIMLGSPGSVTVVPGSYQGYGQASLGAAGSRVGFYGSAGATQQTVSGSDDGNVTLRTLVQALASLGLIVNNTLQQPATFPYPVGPIDFYVRPDAGDGSFGKSDFDFAPYTYLPLAFANQTTYPSGPQWFIGNDHNGYKGAVDGLGALKNLYTSRQTFSFTTTTTGSANKICIALRHTGLPTDAAAAGYLVLDQATATIALGVKAPSAKSGVYTVAGGNSKSLATTPFDGTAHTHIVSVSGSNVLYWDSASTAVPVFFNDPALNATGTYAGIDVNELTTQVNQLSFLPPQTWATFGTTGAIIGGLTTLPSGEIWSLSTSGSGAGATVTAPGNLAITGATSGYALMYTLFGANTLGRTVQVKFGTNTLTTTMGVIGRLLDVNNYYFVNSTQIVKVTAGTSSTLATLSQTFVTGDTMQVSFAASGLITVYRNGTSVGTATDTAFVANNRYGLGVRGVGTVNFSYFTSIDQYNANVIYK